MIWVTGADGQLGHELFHELYEKSGALFTTINECDITNEEAVKALVVNNGVEIIINCAAYTFVDKAESDSRAAFNVNINGPLILAKIARAFDITIIHLSTDYIFAGDKPTPYTEEDTPKPVSIYGLSKLNGELAIQKYAHKSIIFRTSWLYSKYGTNFVKTIVTKSRAHMESPNNPSKGPLELGIVYDQIGNPTSATDLVQVILKTIELIRTRNKDLNNNEQNFSNLFNLESYKLVYNFSNEGIASWYDFAKAVIDILNLKVNVRPILTKDYSAPAKRPYYSVLDKSKIKKELKIEIPYWRESLEKCLKENQF
ncbi:MAG: dTDP-4-dehydrorhamnose reductase [Oligoflexia bacterium]|nr:dTDP-4-dehydrorhamnose reductase [Oligoflexia bacterium]